MQKNRRIIQNKVTFEEIDINRETFLNESEYIYTTRFWLDYLVKETKGVPVLLKITFNNMNCFFVGVIFRKMGIRICGSPFEGWSTPYMGFLKLSKYNDCEKNIIIRATLKYILNKKRCSYVQFCDWNIDLNFAINYRYKFETHKTFYLDISPDEDTLFASFKTDVRTNCRNFAKRGACLKEVEPSIEFCEDYYNQLVKVFEKQQLNSFYNEDKIKRLLLSFSTHPEYIFCENVYAPNINGSIATGIFFGYKKRCYFFGAASYSEYQILRPNEYVIWNAICHWKKAGCLEFDMLGIRKYKEKFCPVYVEKPIIYYSKMPFLHFIKTIARNLTLFFRKKH